MPPVDADVEVLEGETAELTLVLANFIPLPRIAVMPNHDVHFGPVGVGTTFSRVVHISNIGFADLTVSLAITGEAFGIDGETEFTLTPDPMGSNREVLVTFTPTELADYEGLLTITSNDPEHGTVELELNGFGATIVTGGLSVDVVVTDSLGATTPVDSARVRLAFIRDHGGPRPQHFVGWTDANGHLEVPDVPVGTYNVNASKRGIGFASEVVDIVEGQTTFTTLSLVAADSGGHGNPGGPGHGGHHFELVELAGVVSLEYPDSTDSTRVRYLLDVDADGATDYRLNFGPPDYNPPSGAVRPANGDEVTIIGALMSHGEPPMVHVHMLNGELWFDPRNHGEGAHGGDGGLRDDGFGCGDELNYVEIEGVVTTVSVYNSVFLGIDYNDDGEAEAIIDFGDDFDPANTVIPNVGDRIDIIGGMLGCSASGLDQDWVVVYEVDGDFYRMPGETNGLDMLVSISNNPVGVPVTHLIATNYPNPFNPTTTIEFSTPISGLVTMTVFDVLGRQVASLVNENLAAGSYTTSWNAASLPSGMYMYRLTVNEQSLVNRMLLLK